MGKGRKEAQTKTIAAKSNDGGSSASEFSLSSLPGKKTLVILLVVVSFLLYSGSFKNGFTLDDPFVVSANSYVARGMAAIPDLFKTTFYQGFIRLPYDSYRPLPLITFAIQYQLFGPEATSFHVVNVLIYALCVVALFIFLARLLGNANIGLALVTAMLFAVHPIHTEVVANIKGRDDLLCFLFAFSSLYLLARYLSERQLKWLAGGTFCFFLSLLSKESSIIFIVFAPLLFWFFGMGEQKELIKIGASLALGAGVYLLIRFVVLNANNANHSGAFDFIENPLVHAGFAERAATGFLSVALYLKLLAFPHPLVCIYAYNSFPVVSLGDISALFSIALSLGLVVLAIIRLKKDKKDIIGVGIVLFLAPMLVYSNILFLTGAIFAESFAFFSSAGFCLVVARGIQMFVQQTEKNDTRFLLNKNTWLLLAPVLALFAFLSVGRISDWQDNATLFKTDLEKAPENARLNFYYGNELATTAVLGANNNGAAPAQLQSALPYLRKAIALYPHYFAAHQSLASAYFNLGEFDSSITHMQLTLADDPGSYNAVTGLAAAYYNKQDYPHAGDVYKKYFKMIAGNPEQLQYFGFTYLFQKKYDSAIIYFRQSLAIDPTQLPAMDGMAGSFKALGNVDSLNKYQNMVRLKDPGYIAQ